jgi:hypothetical protein
MLTNVGHLKSDHFKWLPCHFEINECDGNTQKTKKKRDTVSLLPNLPLQLNQDYNNLNQPFFKTK